MAGPFTKYLNLEASGPVLYPDAIMDAGTLSVVDMLDNYTFPAGQPVLGTGQFQIGVQYRTFDARTEDFEGDALTFDAPKYAYNGSPGVQGVGAAVSFMNEKDSHAVLPGPWKLDSSMKHFAMGFWLQANRTVATGANNRIACYNLGGPGEQWRIAPIADGDTTTDKIEFYVRTGSGWDLSTAPGFNIDAIFNSVPNQLVFEYGETPDGSKFVQRWYLNGEIIAAREPVARTANLYPNDSAGDAIVGCPAAFSGSSFTGTFRRAWLQDVTKSTETLLAKIKRDYVDNVARMRAF